MGVGVEGEREEEDFFSKRQLPSREEQQRVVRIGRVFCARERFSSRSEHSHICSRSVASQRQRIRRARGAAESAATAKRRERRGRHRRRRRRRCFFPGDQSALPSTLTVVAQSMASCWRSSAMSTALMVALRSSISGGLSGRGKEGEIRAEQDEEREEEAE